MDEVILYVLCLQLYSTRWAQSEPITGVSTHERFIMAHYSYLFSRRKPWPQFNLQTSGSDLFMRQSESMFFCLGAVFLDVLQMAHFSRIMLTLYCHLPSVIRRFHWGQCFLFTLTQLHKFTPLDQLRVKGLAHGHYSGDNEVLVFHFINLNSSCW